MIAPDGLAALYAFRRNVVVAASAGTGKTHALVGVLVHLALGASADADGGLAPPVPLSRIVAATFSRKAAAEIRARVVRELTRLASADHEAVYRRDLVFAFAGAGRPAPTDEDLAALARRALEGVSRARIGTLHGFAATVVRDYGTALGWPPGFRVEDEEDTRARAQGAAADAVERLLQLDEAGARALLRLAGGAGPLVERTAAILERLSEDGRGVASLVTAEGDRGAIEARLETLFEHARRLCEEGAAIKGDPGAAASFGREYCDAWASGDPERIESAAEALCALPARSHAGDAARAFFAYRAQLSGSTHAERGKNLVLLWRARHHVELFAAAQKTLLALAEANLRADMLHDAALGYGQVLCAARDVLATDTRAANELGRSLDALLVDEFQDTSRVQREIVELTWHDPARKDREGPNVPPVARVRKRGLLVVGDRKQSIYAFRGADVGSFAAMCVGLAGSRARVALRVPAGRVWEPDEPVADFMALRDSRRSAPEILSFVNAYSPLRLTAGSQQAELYDVEYAPEIEDLVPAGDAAWEAVHEPRVSWIRTAPGRGGSSSKSVDAEAIARRIARMLEAGTPHVRGAPPRPRDIAVLAMRNAMLEVTAHALARAGIPYVVAGNGFFAAREVQDMLAMLAFIVDPDDKVARVTVLRGIWCGASDETLLALTDPHAGVPDVDGWARGERRALAKSEDMPRIAALRRVVLSLRGASASIGPAETLRHAVRALELEEALLLLPRGEQRVANVRKLIRIAEREGDARAFVARVRRAMDEERPEPEAATFSEDDDAVRLLTVHASKGLDFPIVFLPEAGAAPRVPERAPFLVQLGGEAPAIVTRVLDDDGRTHDTPSYATALADATRRDLAEWARLAYVAVTRAREAVVFVGDRRPPQGADTGTYRSTMAAALTAISERGSSEGRRSLLATSSGPEAAPRKRTSADRAAPGRAIAPVELSRPERVQLTPAERSDFAACPRRFELLHLHRCPEPPLGLAPLATAAREAFLASAARASDEREVAAAYVEARWTRRFVRAPRTTCTSLTCGYVGLCYPDASTAIPPSAR